jgi:hypothetical protein
MSDKQRSKLRSKQNKLLALIDRRNIDESARLDHGAPCVADLRQCIYPEWEHLIDRLIVDFSR